MGERRLHQHAPIAFVHHANQYLITDGYDNRQGLSEIVEGYAAALRLHEHHRIPANLHLSGTLIEALAWHCPWFLTLVRRLLQKGLISLIGGTYAENVMPLFPAALNERQLNEHLWLYRHHLHCPPSEISICWVPERVWDTARLAPVLTSDRLANGGYQYVLLDDRLLYPTGAAYPDSPRALRCADALSPRRRPERPCVTERPPSSCRDPRRLPDRWGHRPAGHTDLGHAALPDPAGIGPGLVEAGGSVRSAGARGRLELAAGLRR
jgi:hypothetical protein